MNAAHTDAWDLPADAPSAFSDLFGELMKTPMQPGSVFGAHPAGYNRGASGPRDASAPDAAHSHRAPPPPTAFTPYGGAGPAPPARLSQASLGQQFQSPWSLPPPTSGGGHAQDPYYHLQQLLNPPGSAPPVCDQPEPDALVDCVVCYDPLPGRPTHGFFSSCHGGQICGGCAAKVDMCPLCRAPKPGREAAVAAMLSSSGNCACSVDGPGGDIAAAAAPMDVVESVESAESGTGVVGVTPRPEGRHEHFDLIAAHPHPHPHQHQHQHRHPEALLPADTLFAAAPEDGFAVEGQLDAVEGQLDTLDTLEALVGSQVFRGLSGGPDAELDEFLVALRAGVKVEAEVPDPVQLVLPRAAPPVRHKAVEPPQPHPQRSSRKRKKTAKAEAAEAAAAAAAATTAPAPTAAIGGRAAAAVARALRDRNAKVGTAKPKARSKAKPAPRAIKMARPSPSTVSKPWAPKPKEPEVVGAGSPFAGVGLSDDRVCDMPFGDLVAAMEKAGFSKERTSEGKAYRKRLKNRRHVMQYSNRKKAGSTTLSSQNDGLKATIISLKKRNDSLVGVHGRLSEELRLATAVRHEAVTGMEDLQAQMAALQSAVAALTVGGV